MFSTLRLRSTALWCATTAAVGGLAAVALPSVAARPALAGGRSDFVDLLVAGCAIATLAAAAWLWVITTDVVVRVLRAGSADRVVVRRGGVVRALVLAACGVVVLGATAAPVRADDGRPAAPTSLAGLPLPDRATGSATGAVTDLPGEVATQQRVRPGDSLWAIAEARLGPGADAVEITDAWHRVYRHNRDLIGPDPDLILPDQVLDLRPLEEDR